MNQNFLLAMLRCAPDPHVASATLAALPDAATVLEERSHGTYAPFAGGARFYKGPRTPARTAEFVARHCVDPDLLDSMIARERRIGVLEDLAINPTLSLTQVLDLQARARAVKVYSPLVDTRLAARALELVLASTPDSILPLLEERDPELVLPALAQHPDLTPEQVRLVFDLAVTKPGQYGSTVTLLAGRSDLLEAGLGSEFQDLTSAHFGYDSYRALATHSRLFDLPSALVAHVVRVEPDTLLRPDLPRTLAQELACTLSWLAAEKLAANPTLDPEILGAVTVKQSPALTSRFLTHRFGSAPAQWETALGLLEGFADATLIELVDAAEALAS